MVETQNKVSRAIFYKTNYDRKAKAYTGVTPLYKELNIAKLSDLYNYILAILGHNYFHNSTLLNKTADKLDKYSDTLSQFTTNLGNNLD